jgi:hypothetical protein
MTPIRHLPPLLALISCTSPSHEHRGPDQHATSQQPGFAAASRPPCDSLASCEDWVIQTADFLHGAEPARFSGSFRTLGDTIRLWFDTATAMEGAGQRWIPVDSVAAILNGKELLAHACRLKGKDLDGQFVAIVRDTAMDKYPLPRLAWQFDVQTAHIRAVPPDSVHCDREYVGE